MVKWVNPIIVDYFTPLALAVWIMDDGGLNRSGLNISTESYRYEGTFYAV